MAKKEFSESEWKKITDLAKTSAEDYGLPQRRDNSVVIGTFNIRKLGKVTSRSNRAWDFLAMICEQYKNGCFLGFLLQCRGSQYR